jgi:hypothetical protein
VEGENRLYTVLSIAGGLSSLAAAIFFGSALAACLSALFFFLSLSLWKYGYLIVPYLVKNAGVVEIGRNFEIPPTQDVIVGKQGGKFLASVFLAARLYESSSEKSERQRGVASEMFEKAVSSAGFPFKVCALVAPLELHEHLEEIRAKRSIAESRRAQLPKKGDEAARLEREIAMWGSQLEKLTEGQKPLEVVFYLSTTASGMSKQEAISRARQQGKELSVVVGSALSCEVAPLQGEEMKRCFWWDFFGPTDRDDLHDQMF